MKFRILCSCFALFLADNGVEIISTKAQAPASIRGEIYDPIGFPLSGAEVKILSGDRKELRHAFTDKNGYYEVRGLPAGDYLVSVEIRGFRRAERDLMLRNGEQASLDVWLEVGLNFDPPILKLAGVIRGTDKMPLRDATITVLHPFSQKVIVQGKSDAQGRYGLDVHIGGQFVVYAYKPRFAVRATAIVLQDDKRLDFMLVRLRT